MKTLIDIQQGTPEWEKFRSSRYGASEAAAMLNISPFKTRENLLKEKALGIIEQPSRELQEIFRKGHEAEASARSIAEEIIGQELFPAVYEEGILSCSCDGITLDEKVIWEHKLYNQALADQILAGEIPGYYMAQVQQMLMITGAEKCLFMTSDGTSDQYSWIYIDPSMEWYKKIRMGWHQFDQELKDYAPTEQIQIIGTPIESLPPIRIELVGEVSGSNLDEFKKSAIEAFDKINTDLQTDQDFADAEQAIKWFKEIERRIDSAKEQALSQTASIERLFRSLDDIRAEARARRLNFEKSVKAKKDRIRFELIAEHRTKFADYVSSANQSIHPYMIQIQNPDFIGAISGKKTVASLRSALGAELARCKQDVDGILSKVSKNLEFYECLVQEDAVNHLFPDLQSLINHPSDIFKSLVKERIRDWKSSAEETRIEPVKPVEIILPGLCEETILEDVHPGYSESIKSIKSIPSLITEFVNTLGYRKNSKKRVETEDLLRRWEEYKSRN